MEIPQAFVDGSRAFLTKDFLPKIERCVERLTDEEIWWRANEHCNSIGNLLLHLSGNVRQWIVSGLGDEPDNRTRQQEFDERSHIPKNELLAKLRSAIADADEVLAKLNSETLLERKTIQGKDVSVMYAIYHVVEHFAMHTGQILMITKQATDKDLAFYDFSTGMPRARW
jgi:uncharacterized damage-inducible protein DinB